jgi:hypothetical protein
VIPFSSAVKVLKWHIIQEDMGVSSSGEFPISFLLSKKKKKKALKVGMVVHACGPSYLGGNIGGL